MWLGAGVSGVHTRMGPSGCTRVPPSVVHTRVGLWPVPLLCLYHLFDHRGLVAALSQTGEPPILLFSVKVVLELFWTLCICIWILESVCQFLPPKSCLCRGTQSGLGDLWPVCLEPRGSRRAFDEYESCN